MKIEAFKSVLTTVTNLKQLFGLRETKMVMHIITSKVNSTLGTIGKATGVKMTVKAVGKNSKLIFQYVQYLNMFNMFNI